MARVIPFKAVRPTRSMVGLVPSRSYDSYTIDERNAHMEYNPFTFLHIINPGFKYHQEIKGENRYELVKNRYLEFKEEGVFVKDEKPSFYIYKIVDRKGRSFTGIIAGVSAEDYENNRIKKHEDTLAYKEHIFKSYLQTVRFNAEPILLTHKKNDVLKTIMDQVQNKIPEFEFTMTERDTHFLWKVDDADLLNKIQLEYKKMDQIYIADGHHRTASSHLLYQSERENNKNHTGDEAYNFFMAFLIPESDLIIEEFNRLVTDLNGLSEEDFLMKLDAFYRIENRGNIMYQPSKQNHFSMYLNGNFYSLYLRKSLFQTKTPLDSLDAQILFKTILNPILGIKDLRNNKRIAYQYGADEFIKMKSEIDAGNFKVGFGLYPANVQQMKDISDYDQVMPPKSTYILPKLRSGITIYEF